MAAGALLYALMGALAKGTSADIPTFELVAARSGTTWLVVEILRRRLAVPLRFHDKLAMAGRSFGGFVAISCYFHSLRLIPLGEAVLLNNMSPVLTSLLAVWLLGERLTGVRVGALALSLGGLWLLLGGHPPGTAHATGAAFGAASAVASAIALVSLKRASRQNRSILIVWSLAAVATVGSLATFDASWVVPRQKDLWLMVGTGVAAAGAQLVTTSGFRLLDAGEASLFGFLTPLCSMVLGGVAFGEWPGLRALGGGALILFAGAGLALKGAASPPPMPSNSGRRS